MFNFLLYILNAIQVSISTQEGYRKQLRRVPFPVQ